MKKLYSILTCCLLTIAAQAQEYNLYAPADCDAAGWLWFDTPEKTGKYVGEANNDDGTWDPQGKMIQLGTTNYAPYDVSYTDPAFVGIGTNGEKGTDGARKGGIALMPASSSFSANGGVVMFYLPNCKKFDVMLASESRIKVRLKGNTTPDNTDLMYAEYPVVSAKYASVFQALSEAGIKEWNDIQTLTSGNEPVIKFDTQTPMVALIENCGADTLYIQAVRIQTYTSTTLGVEEVTGDNPTFSIHNKTVTTPTPQEISVFTLTGNRVAYAKAATTLSLASLPKGIYLVKSGNKSRKVLLD